MFLGGESNMPTLTPLAGLHWEEHQHTRCTTAPNPDPFLQLDDAKAACVVHASCDGIYDDNCNARAPFYLCTHGELRSSETGCVQAIAPPTQPPSTRPTANATIAVPTLHPTVSPSKSWNATIAIAFPGDLEALTWDDNL